MNRPSSRAPVVSVLSDQGGRAGESDESKLTVPTLMSERRWMTILLLRWGRGYKEVAGVLLANGADVNAADKMDMPLAWAIHTRHPDIANLIREHGGHE
jgi:hypothetical protein